MPDGSGPPERTRAMYHEAAAVHRRSAMVEARAAELFARHGKPEAVELHHEAALRHVRLAQADDARAARVPGS